MMISDHNNEIKKRANEAAGNNPQQLDEDLVLTNNLETEAAQPVSSGSPEAGHTEKPSFRQALKEQIHEEEEDAPKGQKMSLIKILGGDFFSAQILRRNILLVMLIGFFVILYISNRYQCEKSMLEIDRLNKELTDAKYKALSTSSRLTEQSRQSNVLEMLKNNKDSVLRIASQPPYIVNVPE